MKKGSYTVEAALLMGILIPLLTGVIYLGFFMELQGQVQAEAMEKSSDRAAYRRRGRGRFPWEKRNICGNGGRSSGISIWKTYFFSA